jgi:hypothetical protein
VQEVFGVEVRPVEDLEVDVGICLPPEDALEQFVRAEHADDEALQGAPALRRGLLRLPVAVDGKVDQEPGRVFFAVFSDQCDPPRNRG